MRRFADLLERLNFTPSRNGKIRLLIDYFDHEPDPDRGWALAAITSTLNLPTLKAAAVRDLVLGRVDPELFGWSYEYVGDLAETVSLIWPQKHGVNVPAPTPTEVVDELSRVARAEAPNLLEGWLDACTASERFALIKLLTGALRVGVSARLVKTALAERAKIDVAEIEEVWHGLEPPYRELFDWLEGTGPRPDPDHRAAFRPLMLANPLEQSDLRQLSPGDFRAEWKWDGIRVQLAARGGSERIFSRSGDDVTRVFPEIVEEMTRFDAVLDGEMLVARPNGEGAVEIAPFNDLQQRLNRKAVTGKMLLQYPAFVRLYDILADGADDLRALPFDQRRRRLEAWHQRLRPARMDVSPLVPFESWDELEAKRAAARDAGIEGLMLKRADSLYVAGRPKGPWWKWKRNPLTLDVVLMYAQRGHGKRSSFYSDYTFGVWKPNEEGGVELVPVGKAYSGYTDEELLRLDRWIRAHTTDRFGPVRQVEPGLVLEVEFDSIHRSTRHRSGVAMRFPRIARLRWDKPAAEADTIETVTKLVT
jgi:DNA ligase-1